ncbi:MAG: (Fe-S)-binding protein [Nitrospirae bacterium]|nr:(Fe-S)-binding protein [Nitrospirota bacterium]
MESSRYLNELLKCVRCGSCKAFCPTYDEDLTETMGARGRLALLLLKGSDVKRRYLRLLTKFSSKRPELSFNLLKIAQHVLFPYLLKKGILPFHIELPEHHLRDRVQIFTVSKKRGRVAVFTGCTVNFLYPHLGESLINVLQKLHYEVILPVGEVCCGAPLRTLGLEKEAIELAKKNFRIFSKLNVDAILSLCPTCTLTLKEEYPKLIGEGIERAMDISRFLINKIDSPLPSLSSQSVTATYHDPCHLSYGLGIKKEPREIIKNIGINLIEAEEERCCGFGGIFSLSYKELSQGLLEKCIGNYTKTGTEIMITACPGCMIQLTKEIKNKPVLHLIEVIEEALFHESGTLQVNE